MFSRSPLLVLSGRVLALLVLCGDCIGKRMWDYEPLSIEGSSTDPTKMGVETRIERLGRGEYALTATFDIKYDMDETTMVEMLSYWSSSGAEEDYKLQPWSIQKQSYTKYTKTHYRDMIYTNLEHCSNMPHPDNVNPWPRGTCKLVKCVFTGEGIPDVLPEGYYKVDFKVTGEVDWGFLMIVRLVTKGKMMG